MHLRRLLSCVSLFILMPLAWGVERFPPPEFSTDYRLPRLLLPAFRPEYLAYLDVAVLALALGVAIWLVHTRRRQRGIMFLLLFSILYFGFYRRGCVCSIGAIQNVALAIFNHDYALPVTVAAFFLLPLATALFAGRVFCAGVCPLGAVQEAVLWRPIKVPAWLEHLLGMLPYLYLGVGVLFAALGTRFFICAYDPFIPLYRLNGPANILIFGGVLLIIGLFVGRPYCRFLCPYGVLLRWVAPLARWKVRITPTTCVQCRLCEDACPYGAIHPPTPPPNPALRHEGKMRLALAIIALPVLLALGGWLGYRGIAPLAYQDPLVIQANALQAQEAGTGSDAAGISRAEKPVAPLYLQAAVQISRYQFGGILFGAWVALVIGGKFIVLSIRRRRLEYEADAAACVGCTRCYQSCPMSAQRTNSATEGTAPPA